MTFCETLLHLHERLAMVYKPERMIKPYTCAGFYLADDTKLKKHSIKQGSEVYLLVSKLTSRDQTERTATK